MLDTELKRQICIKCKDDSSERVVGNLFHDQLRGNPDYIDNMIILNLSTDRMDEESENELHLYFFKDCKVMPDLGLKFKNCQPSDYIDYVVIKCRKDEGPNVRDSIFEQLAGHIDYATNNIILNCSDDRRDGTEDEVHLIFKDYHQQEIPDIVIKGGE